MTSVASSAANSAAHTAANSDATYKTLLKNALRALDEMQARLDAAERSRHAPIAIVGMGCRFPGGANNPESYWRLLLDGVDAVRKLPPGRWSTDKFDDPTLRMSWLGGFLEDIDQFDPQFFGISPREAASIDPQQRLVLEVGWEALESAGQAPDRLANSQTGVFVGITTNDYAFHLRQVEGSQMDIYAATGTALNAAAGRLAFTLGLQGPCMAVDTACSSSLVALHLACRSLRSGECEMALAGGVNATLTPEPFVTFARWGMMAPDGRCKTFDAAADGFVRGEGCGILVLKRLDDALAHGDRVLAVIRGSAVNQDGRSSGLTVPNGLAQQALLRQALADAGVRGGEISYVEAHGTGTALGDPIEVEALGAVLGEGRQEPLALGSVKTNLGHLESAAGIAGLIKLVLALQHETIPPHLHLQERNPRIPWPAFPIEIPSEPRPWPRGAQPRRAGVSGFGFSGVNAHLVLEEAPLPPAPLPSSAPSEVERPLHLLTLSAPTEGALAALVARYAEHAARHPGQVLADAAFTANTGRALFAHRLAVVAEDMAGLQARLSAAAEGAPVKGVHRGVATRSERPRLAFLFTGQGAQYVDMGRQLYATQPAFRRVLDQCAALFDAHLQRPLLSVIFAPQSGTHAALLDDTTYTQPALFAIEYALAAMWQSWGVRPSALLGHSIGEYVAATLAGVMSLEDAALLVAARGRLMGSLPRGGAMAAVFGGPEQVAAALASPAAAPHMGCVSIAAFNGPENVVISGAAPGVAAVVAELAAGGIESRPLAVSHAFHSPLMAPILDEFERIAASVSLHKPQLRLISNLSGAEAGDEVATAAYWRRHIAEPVAFAQGMATLHRLGCRHFIEVGPHPVLIGMGRRCLAEEDGSLTWLPSLREDRAEWEPLLDSLASLYVQGVPVDWQAFDGDYVRRRVLLPTYPFQRQRYWVQGAHEKRAAAAVRPLIDKVMELPLHGETIYEAEFSVEAVPFLADHRVLGEVVSPGAAQLAMALNAAELSLGRQEPLLLQDVVLPQPLAIGAGQARTVQAVFSRAAGQADGEPSRREFKIVSFAAGAAGDADGDPAGEPPVSTHATGYVAAARRPDPAALDIGALRRQCTRPVDIAGLYTASAAAQIELGPSFRWLAEAWQAEDSSPSVHADDDPATEAPAATLARLARPAAAGSLAGYSLHPGLLDACFQVAGMTGAADVATLLPFALGSLHLCHPVVGENWWCYAVQTGRHKWDIQLLDDEGGLVASISGFQVRAAGLRGREAWRDWLYAVQWQPQPLFGLPPGYLPEPAALARALPAQAAAGEEDELAAGLAALSQAYVLAAFDKVGFGWQPGALWRSEQIARQIGVIPSYRPLLERMLALLAANGLVQPEPEGWRVLHAPPAVDPAVQMAALQGVYGDAPALRLLARCGPKLGEVLRGVQEPHELLYGAGATTDTAPDVARLQAGSPAFALLAGLLQAISAHLPAGRGLRLLEIAPAGGNAAGALAGGLLPRLPAAQVEYVLAAGRAAALDGAPAALAQHPSLRRQVLDIEQPPAVQGFAAGMADVVIASDALLAARDPGAALAHVRALLQPGGWLLLPVATARQPWRDLTLGLAGGQGQPLPVDAWRSLLLANGFAATEVVERAGQAVIIATADRVPAPLSEGTWLVLADRGGVGQAVAEGLRGQGARVVTVTAGAGWRQGEAGVVEIAAENAEDYRRLATSVGRVAGVLHLWSLDSQDCSEMGCGADVPGEALAASGSALRLAQALVEAEATPCGLWLVTRGAQAVRAGEAVPGVAQASVWGLGKVAALEHPELNVLCVDLAAGAGAEAGEDIAAQLLAEVTAGAGATAEARESQVALRADGRFVARLVRAPEDEAGRLALPEGPYRLEVSERGSLDNLVLRPVLRRAPGAGEVQVEVQAAGLNFRDVMNVLGAYPGEAGPVGSEFAGVVSAVGEGVRGYAVGDAVLGMTVGSFSRTVTLRAEYVVHKPAQLSMAQAAALPVAHLTAYYGLHRLGRMKAGDRVLIHAAAGGVGMAAVQLAQAVGAEVYATASAGKWEVLRGLGVRHIYNSRDVGFAERILAETGGAGVDILLNSLTGPGFMEANLAVLRTGGRLAEMSKRNIWSAEQVAAVRPDVAYTVFDLGELSVAQPPLWGELMAAVLELLKKGAVRPPRCTVYDVQEAVSAFRLMQGARHVGKVVLALGSGESVIRSDGTYLVTGGLGGLGLQVARWLAEQGARHLLLVGRSRPSAAVQAQLDALAEQGVRVKVAQADVSERERLAEALAEAGQPLRGVIHAAGVLDDGALLQQNSARLGRVLAPKVGGAWNLHELVQEAARRTGRELDFFVLFSSASSVVGNRGQANYAAANAGLDALAHHRRALGLPGLSINWGAWSEVGMAAGLVKSQGAQWAAQGTGVIAPEQGLAVLGYLLQRKLPEVAVLPVNWPLWQRANPAEQVSPFYAAVFGQTPVAAQPEKVAGPPAIRQQLADATADQSYRLLQAYVQQEVAQALQMHELPATQAGFNELGMDSLMTIDLRRRLERGLQISLPSTIAFEYPTVAALAAYLQHALQPAPAQEAAQEAAQQTMQERAHAAEDPGEPALASLSEGELDALLEQELAFLKEE